MDNNIIRFHPLDTSYLADANMTNQSRRLRR